MRRVAVLAYDVIPGMGVPVAAPGIRSWGIAVGLRALGYEVTVIVSRGSVDLVWNAPVPPPTPPGAVLLPVPDIAGYVRRHRIEALVICNSTHIYRLGDLGECRLIYDFFAPKHLELAQNVAREDLEEALESLRQRKQYALGRSDAVIVNGAKKLDYVRGWIERSGVPDLPMAVVNPGVAPMTPTPNDGPLRAIVTGYLQPWSRPGAWVSAVLPLLDTGALELHLLLAWHWGQVKTRESVPEEMMRLLSHPCVKRHGAMRFTDLRRLVARCHLSLDLFERNPERELAMVTRSVVALAGGVPVLHPSFTEVSPIIERYGAGWLVEGDDTIEITRLLQWLADSPQAIDRARAGAIRVAREVFEPAVAARPLATLLEELGPAREPGRRSMQRSTESGASRNALPAQPGVGESA